MADRTYAKRKRNEAQQPALAAPVSFPSLQNESMPLVTPQQAPLSVEPATAAPGAAGSADQAVEQSFQAAQDSIHADRGHNFAAIRVTAADMPHGDPKPTGSIQRQAPLAVQRDGPLTLTPPSLLQPPDPASRYRLGGDMQLQLDPEIEAMAREYMTQQLAPAQLLAPLSQINLNLPASAAPIGPPTAPTASAAPAAAPALAPRPGEEPAPPRAGTVGDITGAVMAQPEVHQALSQLQQQALGQLNAAWRREPGAVVSAVAVIGLGALGAAAASPDARQMMLDQLNGRTFPVPGTNWLRVEINTSPTNLTFGLHADIGSVLPQSWGFGPSSPRALGGPPQPESSVPGQRSIQRVAEDSGARPDDDLARRIIAAAGSGAPIDVTAQRTIEHGLGSDLSDVRVHTDTEADRLSRAVSASAFTTGNDIFFRSGAYNPSSPKGLRLLAHEATHTVQQAAGPVAGTPVVGGVAVSDPADSFEQAAEQAAKHVVQQHETGITEGPSRAQASVQNVQRSATGVTFVQRYDSYEHAQAGDSAPLATKIVIQGIELSSGEINALADLYSTPDAIKYADPVELKNVVDLIRKQKADPKSVSEADWDKATNNRYTQLNLKNSGHFSRQDSNIIARQPSTQRGNDNRTIWMNYHTDALELAKQASLVTDDKARKQLLDEATLINSFGEHFLVDTFSAGHLFNKDDTIAAIQNNLGLLNKDQLAGLFFGVAGKVWIVHSKEISLYEVDIPGPWWPNLDTVDMFRKLLEGMYDDPDGKAAFYSAIVKAAHDTLNTQKDGSGNVGVQVENDFDQWYLSGDRTLSSSAITQKWISKALEQSRLNIQDSSYPQSGANDSTLIARVSAFFPRPTQTSVKAIHDLLAEVIDPKKGMIDAISTVLSNDISSVLYALEQKGHIRKA